MLRSRVGVAVTVKLAVLVAMPPGVVTVTAPEGAPAGTVAVIWVSVPAAKVADTPPKVTAVVPVKPVPVSVTAVPTGPTRGLKPVSVGAGEGLTVKAVAEVAVPPAVLRAMGPVRAPAGTVACTWVSLCTE